MSWPIFDETEVRQIATIQEFYGAGAEQGAGDRLFVVNADEPPVLFGEDQAPNPAEYLLHALTACLTSSIVLKGAARGILIESVESKRPGIQVFRSTSSEGAMITSVCDTSLSVRCGSMGHPLAV